MDRGADEAGAHITQRVLGVQEKGGAWGDLGAGGCGEIRWMYACLGVRELGWAGLGWAGLGRACFTGWMLGRSTHGHFPSADSSSTLMHYNRSHTLRISTSFIVTSLVVKYSESHV